MVQSVKVGLTKKVSTSSTWPCAVYGNNDKRRRTYAEGCWSFKGKWPGCRCFPCHVVVWSLSVVCNRSSLKLLIFFSITLNIKTSWSTYSRPTVCHVLYRPNLMKTDRPNWLASYVKIHGSWYPSMTIRYDICWKKNGVTVIQRQVTAYCVTGIIS